MFITVSHWSLDQITDEMIADAEAEFMPMILDTGAGTRLHGPNWRG